MTLSKMLSCLDSLSIRLVSVAPPSETRRAHHGVVRWMMCCDNTAGRGRIGSLFCSPSAPPSLPNRSYSAMESVPSGDAFLAIDRRAPINLPSSARNGVIPIGASVQSSRPMEDYKYLFKVVLVGNAGVGKTCLVRKFTQGIFPPGQSATIGVDFMIKTVKVDDDKIKLQIWDTAGQERFRAITQSYYRSAHAIVLVYDVACQPSFDGLPEWLSEIEQYANRRVLKILVGNKVDKDDEREIPERIGKSFADANGFEYFLETSALDATNVDTLFQEVATRLTNDMKLTDERYHGYQEGGRPGTVSLLDRAQQQVSSCCARIQ
uniref:Ras-related protein Rab-30 n=1 Tax=Steinernema glaseri TaxID=37863 RepID=A0A1I7YUK3_9BILA